MIVFDLMQPEGCYNYLLHLLLYFPVHNFWLQILSWERREGYFVNYWSQTCCDVGVVAAAVDCAGSTFGGPFHTDGGAGPTSGSCGEAETVV